jgi:hypothetical protein
MTGTIVRIAAIACLGTMGASAQPGSGFQPRGGQDYNHRSVRTAIEAYQIDWNALPGWTTYQYRGREEVATFDSAALTTPIAYLTRMPVDIFSFDENHWTAYAVASSGEKTAFALWSAGPDGDYDFPWATALDPSDRDLESNVRQYDYHATNGTISDGDIITVGR